MPKGKVQAMLLRTTVYLTYCDKHACISEVILLLTSACYILPYSWIIKAVYSTKYNHCKETIQLLYMATQWRI